MPVEAKVPRGCAGAPVEVVGYRFWEEALAAGADLGARGVRVGALTIGG